MPACTLPSCGLQGSACSLCTCPLSFSQNARKLCSLKPVPPAAFGRPGSSLGSVAHAARAAPADEYLDVGDDDDGSDGKDGIAPSPPLILKFST
eukprot:504023-Pelagomonas_calceolata.AAC.3